MGRVDDGSSASDFDPDEIHRKMSINASVLPCEWKNTKINLIDTPGYPDFVGDVVGSLRAVEAALLVVDGTGNIEVGTETGWELGRRGRNNQAVLRQQARKRELGLCAGRLKRFETGSEPALLRCRCR